MKKLFLLLLLCISGISCQKSDDNSPSPEPTPEPEPTLVEEKIYEGEVSLETQVDVENFGAEKYTVITGELYIGSDNTDISDLSSLGTLKKVEGSIYIFKTTAENLKGLHNLDTINMDLHINYNHQLSNLEGLESLKFIDANFNLSYNDNLENLEGLTEVSSVHTFYIQDNKSLTSLSGMEAIKKAIYYGSVFRNESLSDLCGMKNAYQNREEEDMEWTIDKNLYNPSPEQIISGVCKN
ncbi:receptor L domain-containing protein [Christiangramia gaetbulicola]|uniref:Receptor L domain-containing protein n=1 Tax=Christiangramia gaetbulicola TaxID=703340 RepID=A0A2T6AI29_9FLAO|nr:hypothetical protein [Christiangramia gaetbulicola]PTX43466.1 receptor L domain-containing protein [Christiangramia gaetbulicola]